MRLRGQGDLMLPMVIGGPGGEVMTASRAALEYMGLGGPLGPYRETPEPLR
jgi:hypothetical protein